MLDLGVGSMSNATSNLFKSHEKEIHEKLFTNGHKSGAFTNGDAVEVNEAIVTVPPNLADAMVAGWIALAHRYQRDAFHSFTLMFETSGEKQIHTISASDLEILNIQSLADLLKSARRVRPKVAIFEANPASVLILNDGTADEVR